MIVTNKIVQLINEIFLRHRQQILDVPAVQGSCSAAIIASGLKNLECMGYTLDGETIGKLHNTAEKTAIVFFQNAQRTVNQLVQNSSVLDDELQYEPMYPNFPQQVMEASSAELFINAILHYHTDGQWMPGYEKLPCAANSGEEFVPVKLRVLKCGTLDSFKEIFVNLMSAKNSISAADVQDLEFFFENFEDADACIPAEVPFKENAAIIARICIASGRVTLQEFLERHGRLFTNPTDVLRLAAALSGGDESLAEVCRFKSFSRSERKTLLKFLDGQSDLLENMVRNREVWLRLGERLHPGEYPAHSCIAQAFRELRENTKFPSFNGQVNAAISCGRFDEAVKLLSQRPGEFARALDRVLRNSPDQTMVLDTFEAVADRVSTRVLLELRTHFQHRNDEKEVVTECEAGGLSPHAVTESTFDKDVIKKELEAAANASDNLSQAICSLAAAMIENSFIAATEGSGVSILKKHGIKERKQLKRNPKRPQRCALDAASVRLFIPKGKTAQSYIIENTLPVIPAASCQRMVAICEKTLKERFAVQAPLGKVWIADELKDYIVPFSQRSASKALRTVARGSRPHFSSNAKVVRGFVWWKNLADGCRTDVDLTALMLDENWKYLEHISFTNLRSGKTNCCHSGDIVDAPQGAAEYIDIDLEAAQKAGVRYVVFCVYNYTAHHFCDLPECSFGWMEREDVQGGEIFEGSTVSSKIDLAMDSTCGVPVFFDLEEKCAVWMDMATATPLWSFNCVENNANNVLAVCRGFASMHKPDLYDLAVLHAQARGEWVENKEDAEVIFSLEEGITPFAADVWLAEYL